MVVVGVLQLTLFLLALFWIIIIQTVAARYQLCLKVVFDVLVLTDVPNGHLASGASSSQYPRNILRKLHGKQFALLHRSRTNFLRVSAGGRNVPNFDNALRAASGHQIWDVR